MRDVVVLLSGGVDSVTLATKALREERLAVVVFFDYGHAAAAMEYRAATAWATANQVPIEAVWIAVPGWSDSMSIGVGAIGPRVVPGRNVVMLSMTAGVAVKHGASVVWYGAIKDDFNDYPDCRPDFVTAMSAVLGYAVGVSVAAPFISMSKGQVIALGASLGVDITATWSCYEPDGERPCGTCNSCRLREVA